MGKPLNVPIGTIEKNTREDIRVTLTEFKGTRFADVRVYAGFLSTAEDVRGPTKAGVAISFERLPEFVRTLQAAEAKARELGLIGGEA
ncbi:MAG: PC4/YdbC family ssDNA-binding protein [Pseudomonadota bacterium]